jgi:hypothetical protein
MTDFNMLIHHALQSRFRKQKPFACFQERVHENVLKRVRYI